MLTLEEMARDEKLRQLVDIHYHNFFNAILEESPNPLQVATTLVCMGIMSLSCASTIHPNFAPDHDYFMFIRNQIMKINKDLDK